MKSVHDDVMPCDVFIERITDYMEEALPARQRARFEQHLAFCPGCVTILEQMRSVARTLASPDREGEAPPAPPPSDSPEASAPPPRVGGEPAGLKPALADAFQRWKRTKGLP